MIRRCLFIRILFILLSTLLPLRLTAVEELLVHYPEGTAHAFLLLRSVEGKVVAEGDFTQTLRKQLVTSHLLFRFKDGSRDEDTTEFSQNRCFRLLRDHHMQKGPSFPHPTDVLIDMATGTASVRETTKDNQIQAQTEHVNFPPNLTNGIFLHILKNIPEGVSALKLPYLAATPKPRIVQLIVSQQGIESFTIGGFRYRATHFQIKTELGGIAGAVAPLLGKQPADVHVWVTAGTAPTLARLDGPLYLGGPILSIQLGTPLWSAPF